MKIYCLKNLKFEDGTTSFKKGKGYKILSDEDEIAESTSLLDEQGDRHELGTWHKFFCSKYAWKIIKGYERQKCVCDFYKNTNL